MSGWRDDSVSRRFSLFLYFFFNATSQKPVSQRYIVDKGNRTALLIRSGYSEATWSQKFVLLWESQFQCAVAGSKIIHKIVLLFCAQACEGLVTVAGEGVFDAAALHISGIINQILPILQWKNYLAIPFLASWLWIDMVLRWVFCFWEMAVS